MKLVQEIQFLSDCVWKQEAWLCKTGFNTRHPQRNYIHFHSSYRHPKESLSTFCLLIFFYSGGNWFILFELCSQFWWHGFISFQSWYIFPTPSFCIVWLLWFCFKVFLLFGDLYRILFSHLEFYFPLSLIEGICFHV